jgi:hypothetical protein
MTKAKGWRDGGGGYARLVQSVLGGRLEKFKSICAKRENEQRRAAKVEDSVLSVNHLGQNRASKLGRHGRVWREDHTPKSVGDGHSVRIPTLLVRVEHTNLRSTVDARCQVVGVTCRHCRRVAQRGGGTHAMSCGPHA